MSRVLWCVAARGALLMVAMGSALLMLFANGADVSAAPAIKLTQVYSGFTQPVFMAQPPDGTNRLFVVERAGRIRLIVNGVHQSTPFLDLQSQITSAGEEQGMLGLAFHPNFRANRRFYVYYTDAQGNDTLARYEASTTNPNVASLTTRTILFSFPDRYDNHNGGMLAFGRDGLLYVGIGDEGSSGDPSNNAQNIDSPFGKILRLNGEGLAVPSNPFYSGDPTATRSRVWALGLRNPWRFSFDRANGDMYIGDVGQDSWEEVDRRAYGSGVFPNFQWSCLEGTHPFDTSRTCTRSTQVRPISEYDHSNGSCAITGGYVYRGSRVASLVGEYVYGDYCSGMIWTLTPGTWTRSMSFASGLHIASFAEDQAGNLYVIDITNGRIYRIDDGA